MFYWQLKNPFERLTNVQLNIWTTFPGFLLLVCIIKCFPFPAKPISIRVLNRNLLLRNGTALLDQIPFNQKDHGWSLDHADLKHRFNSNLLRLVCNLTHLSPVFLPLGVGCPKVILTFNQVSKSF
jgi:hypothetical protein